MPYFTYYGSSTDCTDTWSSLFNITAAQIQQDYEEYRRKREQQDLMMEQMWQEEQERIDKMDELRRDKEKYPLFFLKEGIV